MTAVYETHMHTPLCKHAEGEVEDYAEVAERRGLAGITVTCHNPLPDGYNPGSRMNLDQFDAYLGMIERARSAFAGRVDVRLGMEFDYVPQFEGFLRQQVRWADFDYRIGSVHPQMPEWQERFAPDDPVEMQRIYFDHLACAAETGLFHAISHPDLIKNITPGSWNPGAIESDIARCLDRIAATGCAMELNTSGVNKAVAEMNPGQMMLRMMRQRGIAAVVGADAHVPGRVADGYAAAYDLLEEAGYDRVVYFLGGRAVELPVADARRALESG